MATLPLTDSHGDSVWLVTSQMEAHSGGCTKGVVRAGSSAVVGLEVRRPGSDVEVEDIGDVESGVAITALLDPSRELDVGSSA